jgi:hypothetical protein
MVEGLLMLRLYALPSLYRQGYYLRVNLYQGDIGLLLRDDPNLQLVFERLAKHLSESDLHQVQRIVDDLIPKMDRFGPER